MSTAAAPILDALAPLVNAETQKMAARMAQDVFTGTFRLTLDPDSSAATGRVMAEVESRCHLWSQAGESDAAQAARLALLISGLDQWGLAYSQTFQLHALPALSSLIGALRHRLDPQAEARFQGFFSQIDQVESDAIDFKVELRRSIHLALWHAMAACETEAQAQAILQALGSLLLVQVERLPTLGWRLVADALANIQVALLNDPEVSEVAQVGTRQLFESLRHALPPERYQAIHQTTPSHLRCRRPVYRPATNASARPTTASPLFLPPCNPPASTTSPDNSSPSASPSRAANTIAPTPCPPALRVRSNWPSRSNASSAVGYPTSCSTTPTSAIPFI